MKFKRCKSTIALFAVLLLFSVFFGCSKNDADATIDTNGGDWEGEAATMIAFDGTSIAISGTGAEVDGTAVTITAAGIYVLSGSFSDGQVIVEAADSDEVQIVLNGVELNCSNNAPIVVNQADKVILTLAEGTDNTVTDGTSYDLASGEDEPNAAIYSKDDLTINGAGALTVTGNYLNGILSKDSLKIKSGAITVTAVNDGLRGRDEVNIEDGAIVVNAGSDAIQSNNDEDTTKGLVTITGGTLDLTAGNDGIQAATTIDISGVAFTISSGGGSANASTDQNGEQQQDWGEWGSENTEDATDEEAESTSAKGLKAGTALTISGGTFELDTSDDAIHSNDTINISGGTINISSGDDGVHADNTLVVDGGTFDISQSYEGLEATAITVNGGAIHVIASDDGFNAAGGADGSSTNGRAGQNDFSEDTSAFIRFTDGYVYINADGDGIDSNGSLYVDGGTVLVNGPTNDGNGPLDYTGTAEITGGTFVAVGSSGMAQTFSSSSTQAVLMVVYSSTQKADTLLSLEDASGNALLAFAPAKNYQSVVISTPDLEQGGTYTLYSGGTAAGDGDDGLYTSASGATKVVSTALSSISTSISDSGGQVRSSGGGQMMGR